MKVDEQEPSSQTSQSPNNPKLSLIEINKYKRPKTAMQSSQVSKQPTERRFVQDDKENRSVIIN